MEQFAGTLVIHNISYNRVYMYIAIDTAFGTFHLQIQTPSILMYISMIQVHGNLAILQLKIIS